MTRSDTYSISELAKDFDVTTRTIRFYEEKGLLKPTRRGQHRIYSAADRVRLQLILRGKRIGLSLEESRDIIDMYRSHGDNTAQYRFLIDKVQDKRSQLQAQIEDIKHLMKGLKEVEARAENALTESLAAETKHAKRN